jgi:hypothetical protein
VANGLYIGQPMPSDDYWFVVEYTEESILKKYPFFIKKNKKSSSNIEAILFFLKKYTSF